uniref:Protein regulator of cytokinesis 1 n=1 Tax=Anolis carolinensis TaxID=28377 RepID=H9G3I9_ANOCA|nr:PREDICTED: protein regulator of cytokinesis 1 isoform X1 [Anolis carolinensis]|eukprot:XP_003223399.1 PREDICTED: protein regulator of cytokinesis 1 isoform X1 [Anolis carolinensis]
MPRPVSESEVLAASLVNSVTQALGKLQNLWDEMGISRESQMERMQAAKGHIETLLNEMIEEESNMKEKIQNDIEMHKHQLDILRHELRQDPYKVDPTLTILQLEKMLRLTLEDAHEEKNQRLTKLKQLQQEEQALCTELCATPYYIPTGSIPSSLQLQELKEHIEKLSETKEQRQEEFVQLREEIKQYNKEIGHIPDGTLENEILDEECICLTKKNLEDMRKLLHQLQTKKESLTASRAVLMKEVQLLWNRLQWPKNKCDEFLRRTSKFSISEAIKMWEEELLVLEEQKKEHLKEITLKVREELDTYWNKCYFCGEQRATFQPFYNDNYSEELLSLHDEELVKIRAVYEKNKSLYESVQKWEAILERFVELEKKSADPSRLLNRGGSLLRDEKERSKIQKQLLKLEEELKRNIENWEKENGSSFLVNNQRFLDTMAQQLQHHKLKKDHQSKISVKKEEFATSRRTVKRPAEESTPTTSKKTCKVASSLKAFSCSNLSTGTAVGGKQPFQAKMPYKSVRPEPPRQLPLEECKESKPTQQPSYSDFMKELSTKSSCTGIIFNSTLKENFPE